MTNQDMLNKLMQYKEHRVSKQQDTDKRKALNKELDNLLRELLDNE